MKFYGAIYSKSIKRSIPSDITYYLCSDPRSVGCPGRVEFKINDYNARNHFNNCLGYRDHHPSCKFVYSNQSLERLMSRSRTRQEEKQQESRKAKRSAALRERQSDKSCASKSPDPKSKKVEPKVEAKAEAKTEPKAEPNVERSETYELFKCMFDFENNLKSLVKYTEVEENRKFVRVKINDYRSHFEKLSNQFQTNDDKALGSAVSVAVSVSSSSDLKATCERNESVNQPGSIDKTTPNKTTPIKTLSDKTSPDNSSVHQRKRLKLSPAECRSPICKRKSSDTRMDDLKHYLRRRISYRYYWRTS